MIKLKSLLTESKEKLQTVYKNRWISIKKIKLVEDESGYFYLHEERCNGKIIAVLLYRRTGKDAWEYGVRKEVTPAWGSEKNLSALTGGCEKGMSVKDTAIKEIEEESGYIVKKDDLESLGTCRGTKSTDTIYHLFAVDVTDKKPGEKKGDGSKFDNEGTIEWMYYNKDKFQCPILTTMVMRLGFG
jgi:8-oxo-dGTP pyrophosphatase MutT (NUDIX family)